MFQIGELYVVSVTNSQRGLTLIELLVGLTISSFIIVGAVFVYSQSRNDVFPQRHSGAHSGIRSLRTRS